MLTERNGKRPRVHPSAVIADSARVIGDVTIGSRCYIDHHVVVESSGPPIDIGDDVIVFAGSVIRSVGGSGRPAFPVDIGARSLIAPHCTLTGCRIGHHCYIATAAIALQGAIVGDQCRIGVAAIVHANTVLPRDTRVGMRHVAVPTQDGFISTADIEVARKAVGAAGFFETAFGLKDTDPASLHEQVMMRLLEEVHAWHDSPL
jgi:carbonic anhydrase/acetyltransferase-like protein (isoleucine patch superfamily)